MARSTGTVKWFSPEKGYGFIRQDDGPDVFVHHTAIEGTGFRTLEEGERVEFDIVQEPRGLKARHVVRPEPAPGRETARTSPDPRHEPTGRTRRNRPARNEPRSRGRWTTPG